MLGGSTGLICFHQVVIEFPPRQFQLSASKENDHDRHPDTPEPRLALLGTRRSPSTHPCNAQGTRPVRIWHTVDQRVPAVGEPPDAASATEEEGANHAARAGHDTAREQKAQVGRWKPPRSRHLPISG